MLKSIDQIENPNKLYVLKECWAGFAGMGSGQKIIANRWMIPIDWIAKQCSMGFVETLEEHLFACNLDVDSIGSMKFLRDYANAHNYALTAVVCATLRYEDGSIVYADITEQNKRQPQDYSSYREF